MLKRKKEEGLLLLSMSMQMPLRTSGKFKPPGLLTPMGFPWRSVRITKHAYSTLLTLMYACG
jgi:hypothetical protein